MSITPERKQELIKEYGLQEGDTGSPEVQIAIITERVKNLTEHLKEHLKPGSEGLKFQGKGLCINDVHVVQY